MDTFKTILEMICYTLITGCGIYIIGKILTLVNKKIDEIQAATDLSKYAKLNKYIDDAQVIIATAVETVSQTFVDSLKASGDFNKDAQIEAKDRAIEIAKRLITADTITAINTLRGDFQSFLDTSIESAVRNSK